MVPEFEKQMMLEKLRVGFEFEFFSPFNRAELAHLLSTALGKNVAALESHDPGFQLDENTFKIEPDFSGGLKMHEFVTAPLPYSEAVHTLFKVFNFIDERAHTTNRCGLHINISVDDPAVKESMRHLNIFKFILGLDENKVYGLWPSGLQSKLQKVFKNPISYIHPKNRFLSENVNAMTLSNPMDFKIPQTKYHGVNFTKLQEGYLEIRYAGGKDYQKKKKEAFELVNLIGEHIINTLSNNKVYTDAELLKLKDIIDTQRHYINTVRTYESFVRHYPGIKLSMNMQYHPQAIKANYYLIREQLCDLLEYTEMTEGELNFDSDRKRLQVRGAKIKSGFVLSNIDLLECEIEAELEECLIHNCKVRGSLVKKSHLSTDNDIRYSLLEECFYHESGTNVIKNSYLKNEPFTKVNGRITECVINKGIISINSEVDSKTELVSVGKDGSSKK